MSYLWCVFSLQFSLQFGSTFRLFQKRFFPYFLLANHASALQGVVGEKKLSALHFRIEAVQKALAVLVLFSPQEFEVADATTTEGEIKDWQPDRGLNASHTAQNIFFRLPEKSSQLVLSRPLLGGESRQLVASRRLRPLWQFEFGSLAWHCFWFFSAIQGFFLLGHAKQSSARERFF